ncbi:MAG: peptidase M16 [Flavobacteriales bacterium]|nr:MAG: peptidase M16 [Flavobacteriales bacterium]
MKTLKLLFSGMLFVGVFISCDPPAEQQKYNYESVPNDPMDARIYTLENGLKVYLSVNKDEPRVQTAIAVRAGSKNDPADCTGLAHYLEHMLFKGSSKIATTNWEQESKVLQQISGLFEEHKISDNDSIKRNIYNQIDSLSQVAVAYAVPNEYDKMISSIGAKGTNAFTSDEQTVYINDIPSNELEKWLMIEYERFGELVLRLFHTELETVYEEFNRGQDSDFRKVYKRMAELLFPNHPYGTQPTIGHGEHLKNPSMEKIHEYFNTYYVPNNMAISIAGDIDPDETIALIDKYFGKMQPKELPEFTYTAEKPITEPMVDSVYGPMMEFVAIAFRNEGAHSDNALYMTLIEQLLNNGQAGLMDLNLVQKQKVLRCGAGLSVDHDYSSFNFFGIARPNQSLDEVKDLMLGQLELIKKGEFDDWMLEAIINDMRLSEMRQMEYNWIRALSMVDAFILQRDWKDVVEERKRLKKITKNDVVKFANENFNDNYVMVKKLKGQDTTLFKVQKPKITPLDIERDVKSAFRQKLDSVDSKRLKPVFVDYKTAIKQEKLVSGIEFNYIKNTTNETFQLDYILDMGRDHDKKLPIAIKYLPYLGTSKYSPEELQKEFFKLGLSFDVFTSRDRVYVFLNGLEDNFEKGVELFEHVLADVVGDQEAFNKMIDGIAKERSDAKLNKGTIHRSAMGDYAKYGENSPFTNILSMDELKELTPDELVETIKSLGSYQHRVFYYGKREPQDVMAMVDKYHTVPEQLKEYPDPMQFTQLETTENKVYYIDYDMVQTEMMLISKGGIFDKSILPHARIFNEYFGSGLSSIVFQEIREAKALAYSAYCSYRSPGKMDESHYISAYVGTQTDKLHDAVTAMLDLMNNMPEAKDQFEGAKLSALKKIETDRITRQSIFWSYENAKKRGYDYDYRKDIYGAVEKMTMDDLKAFFNENVKGKNYTYLVIGKKSEMDFEVLKSMGEFKELTLEEVFGY